VSLPLWRIQSATAEGLLAVRAEGHPFPGQVRVEHTDHGFTIEFEERWDHNGQRWYCREMIRASEQRVVVVEFPSMDRLRGWYSSADYAEGLPIRDTALTRRLLFVL